MFNVLSLICGFAFTSIKYINYDNNKINCNGLYIKSILQL